MCILLQRVSTFSRVIQGSSGGHPGVVQAYRDSHSARIKRSQVSQVISQLLELVLFFVPKFLELRMPFLVLRRAFLMLMRPFLMLRRPWWGLRNEIST